MPGKLVRIVFRGEENHIKEAQNLAHLLVSARKHFYIFKLKACLFPSAGPWPLAEKQKEVVQSLGWDVYSQIMMCAWSIWSGKGGVHLRSVSMPCGSAPAPPAFTDAGGQQRNGWTRQTLPSSPHQWSWAVLTKT